MAMGYVVVVVLLAGVLLLQLKTVHDAVSTNRSLASIVSRLVVSSSEQISLLDVLDETANKYWVTGDTGYRDRFFEARSRFAGTLATLDSLPLSGPEGEAVERLTSAWSRTFPSDAAVAALLGAPRQSGVPEARQSALRADLDTLRRETRNVYRASRSAMLDRIEASSRSARQAEAASWGALAAAFIFGAGILWYLVSSITKSVDRLREGTRIVAGGDFSHRLGEFREAEFAELARDFNVMTRRLGELDRAKNDFLSQVSHDLKTPLAAIRETNQLLLDGLPGALNPKQRKLVEDSLHSGRRLSAMIDKLLDLSRLEAGAVRYELRIHDLRDLVDVVSREFAHRGRDREISLDVRRPDDDPLPVRCDGERTVEVLENLLENAVRFSPRGGTVGLRVEAVDRPPADAPEDVDGDPGDGSDGAGFVLVSVSDEGPGVADGERERIFERFHQSEEGRRTAGGGVGLGLSICREIVRAHDGSIWVTDGPGGGTVFRVLMKKTSSLPEESRGTHVDVPETGDGDVVTVPRRNGVADG